MIYKLKYYIKTKRRNFFKSMFSVLKIVNIDEKLPNVKINIIYNSKYLTVAPKKFINMYIDKTIN